MKEHRPKMTNVYFNGTINNKFGMELMSKHINRLSKRCCQ